MEKKMERFFQNFGRVTRNMETLTKLMRETQEEVHGDIRRMTPEQQQEAEEGWQAGRPSMADQEETLAEVDKKIREIFETMFLETGRVDGSPEQYFEELTEVDE